jgi:hypothetical protein
MRLRFCFVLACAAGIPVAASAQLRREFQDQPAARFPATHTSPAFQLPGDNNFLQRQVNVNAAGLNIVGDAANEPSIAVDPTAPNRIAIGWRQFDSIASNFRQAGRAYSRDGGRTWTNPGPLTPGTFRSDPVLRADREGRIFYSSLTTNPYQTWAFVSTDGGATFPNSYTSFGDDKQWISIDLSTGPSSGAIYQHYSIIQGSNNFTRSLNHGVTWMTPIPQVPVWGTSTVSAAGVLYISGVDFPSAGNSGPILVARSANAGTAATPTFTTVTANVGSMRGFIDPSPNPGGLLGQVQVGVDRSGGPRNGWVYALASAQFGNQTDPLDIYFNRSTDGGQTWLSTPIRVNNDPQNANAWQFFGTMSVAPNGRIDVVWGDTRQSLQPNLARLYYAYSNDGGATWLGNIALGPQWNSWVGWPQQNKIGDYYDMESDRVGAFLACSTTYNGEQDVHFIRINDFDCNGNGIGDTQDLASGVLHDCDQDGNPDECELAAGTPVMCVCYANCDASTQPPILNVGDFTCFLQRFAAGDSYANCDASTQAPVLNVGDFTCFLQRFAAGCP